MSDRDPGTRRYPRDPGLPPESWSDEHGGGDQGVRPGSSVFGPPGAPAAPAPRGPAGYRPRPPDTAPRQHDTWPQGYPSRPPDTAAYPAETWPPDTAAYPTETWPPGPAARPAGRRPRPPQGPARHDPGPPDPWSADEDRAARRGGRRSPVGAGALIGGLGAAALVAALTVLPWFEALGQEVGLDDIRTAFTVTETDPDDLLPADGAPPSTLPDGVPSPDEVTGAVTDAVEQRVRDEAARAAAAALDSGRARYLELYADTLWLVVAGAVVVAVVASTVFAPRSAALSLLLGVRRLAGVVIVLAAAAHGAALWVVFGGTGPSPAAGVWAGVAGLAAALVGCIVGPRRAGG